MALEPETEFNAIDLTATMVAEQLAAELDISQTHALEVFLSSRTAELLYDPSLKLWWDGPSSVVAAFLREKCL